MFFKKKMMFCHTHEIILQFNDTVAFFLYIKKKDEKKLLYKKKKEKKGP